MFRKQTLFFSGGAELRIPAPDSAVIIVVIIIMGIALLNSPAIMFAQHGGGGGGRGMGSGAGPGRPGGVSEKDDLKDFHRSMAVQATADQSAAFAKIVEYTRSASDRLQVFRESPQKTSSSSAISDSADALHQAVDQARAGNQNFLASFSAQQKSGLKDMTNRLGRADTELDKQMKALDQAVRASHTVRASHSHADSEQIATVLYKALENFQNEQLALGREMGILLDPAAQDLAFLLPTAISSINIGGQQVSIPVSGVVRRTSAENGHNLFGVRLTADLSDLQQNVTGALRPEMARAPHCGERIEILQGAFTALPPSSMVVVRFHYERWICPPGQTSPIEAAAGDATIEVKLTPSIETTAGLRLISEVTRVDGDGFLRDMLRSGELGVTLREQIAAVMLSSMQRSTNLKAALPPMAQASATLQRAQFQEARIGQLSLVVDGEVQLSDEQTRQFSVQLKQQLSAEDAAKP